MLEAASAADLGHSFEDDPALSASLGPPAISDAASSGLCAADDEGATGCEEPPPPAVTIWLPAPWGHQGCSTERGTSDLSNETPSVGGWADRDGDVGMSGWWQRERCCRG